jgi:hypothetical protein
LGTRGFESFNQILHAREADRNQFGFGWDHLRNAIVAKR